MTRYLFILFVFLSVTTTRAQMFSLLPKEQTGIDFVNVMQENKSLNVINYVYLYNGAGVAIGDINNDGLSDIFFTGNLVENRLYINQGNLKFKEITIEAGVQGDAGFYSGVTMVDINNDGWLDIYTCKTLVSNAAERANKLFVNNKNGTFTEKAKEYGLADSSYSTQAYFYDFDKDGDMDLYLVNTPYKLKESKKIVLSQNKNGKLEAVQNSERQYVSDRYYENVNGKYVDKTIKAGIGNYAFGLSAIVDDFNNDSYPDVYVCNDFTSPDFLYINNKNGTFTEKLDDYFDHINYFGMGSDFADINNDGYSDLMVVDMMPETNERQKQMQQALSYDQFDKLVKYGLKAQYAKNVLQLNNQGKNFSDIAYHAGLAFTDWSWAPLIADFDNDGLKDIYITNGYYRDLSDMDYAKFQADSIGKAILLNNSGTDNTEQMLSLIPSVKISNYLYKNNGTLKLEDVTKISGLDIPSFSNGAAYADLDNDGDLEIVVSNINDFAFVFKNNTIENSKNNFIRFKCVSNTKDHAYGTKIEIKTPDGKRQFQTYNPVKGYLSKHESFVHFGLGNSTSCDVKITYPNGKTQTLNSLKSNSVYTLNQVDATTQNVSEDVYISTFIDVTKNTGLNVKHTENEYLDFKLEPLIPRQFSKQGPAIAVADVNGDKLEDFFIGGATNQEASLYLQNAEGKFAAMKNGSFELDKKYEDVTAEFLDIDNDNDKDLIVLSGGNEYPKQLEMYPVRLYINDGKGIFSKASTSQFPTIHLSSKAIAIEDFDKDGDIDVFIAGRIIPGAYGRSPQSYLLVNNKGSFTTEKSLTSFEKLGMVSDAKWVDGDGDGWKDLILVGEWMPITVLKNANGKIEDKPVTLNNKTYGWWNSIDVLDINNDGKDDMVFGNYGTNTRYKCSEKEPMTMLVNDFDNNGSTDCVISMFYNDGISHPTAIRDNVLDQMVYLKKKYIRYKQYGNTTINEMFTVEQRNSSEKYFANNMKSMVALNKGAGVFDFKYLLEEAQLFPVQKACVYKPNQNENLLLLVGNDYGVELETGRGDAGKGLVLQVMPDGSFVKKQHTGFNTKGDVKNLVPIKIRGKGAWIIAKNNDYLQVIQENK